jgi:hypothetical protein
LAETWRLATTTTSSPVKQLSEDDVSMVKSTTSPIIEAMVLFAYPVIPYPYMYCLNPTCNQSPCHLYFFYFFGVEEDLHRLGRGKQTLGSDGVMVMPYRQLVSRMASEVVVL